MFIIRKTAVRNVVSLFEIIFITFSIYLKKSVQKFFKFKYFLIVDLSLFNLTNEEILYFLIL